VEVGISCPGGVENWAIGDGIQKPKVQLKRKLVKDVNGNKKGFTQTQQQQMLKEMISMVLRELESYHYKITLYYL